MKKGFTLIELLVVVQIQLVIQMHLKLVVVLIIGILSSIALPQYTKAVEKARLSEALSMIGSLKTGIDAYVLANGYQEGYFIGGYEASTTHITLDVDPEAILDCSSLELCEGKYFSYSASCGSSSCEIWALRGNTDDYYAGEQKYNLYITKNVNGWTYKCVSRSKVGNHICKSLQTQGWTATLYSE